MISTKDVRYASLCFVGLILIFSQDGGQWVGLKNEAVDAMDALVAELR
jgi:hypothetical protein